MLRTGILKAAAIASALALSAMAPALAAGRPPDDRGGAGGSQLKSGGVYAAAPMAPGAGSGGSGEGPPDGVGGGGGAGKPDNPGDDEGAGNNLSYPVLWSESGYSLVLRTADDLPVFDGASAACTEVTGQAALQKDAKNIWQADNEPVVNVTNTIDWGDALEATDANSKMQRVEVSLYSNLAEPMNGYAMCKTNTVTGPGEMWGAINSGPVPTAFTDAMVYTAGGRLTIQRVVPDRAYAWNSTTHQWTGSGADDPVFNAAVHERTSDGPGTFGVEVTISGKITYGYVWSTDGLPLGEYRLTFSLDGPHSDFTVGSGTSFTDATKIAVPEEETAVEEAAEEEEGGAPGANSAVLRSDLNLTYIDVGLGVRTDPVPPIDEPTTPPTTGGGSSTPAAATTTDGAAPATQPESNQPEVTTPRPIPPQAATALFIQKAKVKATKSGKYPVGQVIVLTKRPLKTDAGVTVRWRATKASLDNCTVERVKKGSKLGRVTATLTAPGRCRVIGWAPPASPDFAPFKVARTYRVTR